MKIPLSSLVLICAPGGLWAQACTQTPVSTPNYVYGGTPTICVPTVYASTSYLNIYNQLATKDCTSTMCSPTWPNPPGNLYVGSGDEPDFNTYVATLSGTGTPMLAGQLTAVNANNGQLLLSPSTLPTAQMQIAAWKAVGAKAMFVQVGFPMLYGPFMATAGTNYQTLFSSFYGAVARLIRAQGMKVCVELIPPLLTGGQLSGGNWPSLQDYYNSLTTISDYATARAGQVTGVISAMQPDYLVIMEEPDTESKQTGQSIENLYNAVQVLNAAISAARAASSVKIGAGFGAWLQSGACSSTTASSCVNSYLDFAQGLSHQNCGGNDQGNNGGTNVGTVTCLATDNSNGCMILTGCYLDYLDIHVFPIPEQPTYCTAYAAQHNITSPTSCPQAQFWYNSVNAVSTAAAGTCNDQAGTGPFPCPFGISQAWLRKVQAQNTAASGYNNDDWPSDFTMTSGTGATHPCGGSNDCRAGDIQEARETFSFWSTLDLDFIYTLWTMAEQANGLYVGPFNTQNLTAGIPWSTSQSLYPDGDGTCAFPCGSTQPRDLFSTEQSRALFNLPLAGYTDWATGFHDLVGGAEGSGPSVPTGLAAIMISSTPAVALVTWNPSTDLVGVAFYEVQRGGTTVAASLLLNSFIDTSSSGGSKYRVRAYNLGYNGAFQYSDWTGAVALQAHPTIAAVGQISISGHVAVH